MLTPAALPRLAREIAPARFCGPPEAPAPSPHTQRHPLHSPHGRLTPRHSRHTAAQLPPWAAAQVPRLGGDAARERGVQCLLRRGHRQPDGVLRAVGRPGRVVGEGRLVVGAHEPASQLQEELHQRVAHLGGQPIGAHDRPEAGRRRQRPVCAVAHHDGGHRRARRPARRDARAPGPALRRGEERRGLAGVLGRRRRRAGAAAHAAAAVDVGDDAAALLHDQGLRRRPRSDADARPSPRGTRAVLGAQHQAHLGRRAARQRHGDGRAARHLPELAALPQRVRRVPHGRGARVKQVRPPTADGRAAADAARPRQAHDRGLAAGLAWAEAALSSPRHRLRPTSA